MEDKIKIGIIICDNRCRMSALCAGGKCLRALHNREGAFSIYQGREVDLVGFATCGGCPGGYIEYIPAEMKRNGACVIHLSTGLVVGYPPCPYITYFCDFIREKFGLEVVIGTHPIPQKYYNTHMNLGTWTPPEEWKGILQPTLADEETRLSYD